MRKLRGFVWIGGKLCSPDSLFERFGGIFVLQEERTTMNIAQIISDRDGSDIISCDVSTPVSEAVGMLAGKRIGALPVMRDGLIAGIISERDVIYCLADKGHEALDLTVGDIMTSPAITVQPDTLIDDALSLMTRRRFRHFPVVDGETLVAFISIGDLVKHKIDEVEHEAAALRDYIQHA